MSAHALVLDLRHERLRQIDVLEELVDAAPDLDAGQTALTARHVLLREADSVARPVLVATLLERRERGEREAADAEERRRRDRRELRQKRRRRRRLAELLDPREERQLADFGLLLDGHRFSRFFLVAIDPHEEP